MIFYLFTFIDFSQITPLSFNLVINNLRERVDNPFFPIHQHDDPHFSPLLYEGV